MFVFIKRARLKKKFNCYDLCNVLATYFALETGCRPSEAAYLVLNSSFKATTEVNGCDFIAIVPASLTKTGKKYRWAMRSKVNIAINLVKKLHEKHSKLSHIKTHRALAKTLYAWFKKRILVDAAKESNLVKDEVLV